MLSRASWSCCVQRLAGTAPGVLNLLQFPGTRCAVKSVSARFFLSNASSPAHLAQSEEWLLPPQPGWSRQSWWPRLLGSYQYLEGELRQWWCRLLGSYQYLEGVVPSLPGRLRQSVVAQTPGFLPVFGRCCSITTWSVEAVVALTPEFLPVFGRCCSITTWSTEAVSGGPDSWVPTTIWKVVFHHYLVDWGSQWWPRLLGSYQYLVGVVLSLPGQLRQWWPRLLGVGILSVFGRCCSITTWSIETVVAQTPGFLPVFGRCCSTLPGRLRRSVVAQTAGCWRPSSIWKPLFQASLISFVPDWYETVT